MTIKFTPLTELNNEQIVNLKFLLILSGDIETNPGPSCPCGVKKARKVLFITCSECNNVWHVDCVGMKEITEIALEKLITWLCPACIVVDLPSLVKETLVRKLGTEVMTNVMQLMTDMEDRLNAKIENLASKKEESQAGYSDVARRKIESKVDNANRMLYNMTQQKDPAKVLEEKKEKATRTLIVKKYRSKNIKTSDDIRKVINKEYPGEIMRNVRTTAGGSILLELDDHETSGRIKNKWKKTLFGGNEGVVMIKENPPAGLIKNVFTDEEITEDDITDEIKKTFPDIEVDFFHNKDEEFTGTIKLMFKSEEELEDALKIRVGLFQQRYIIEKYIYRPRVIKCNFCQKFGHVARVCRSENPVCGKCSRTNHETINCQTPTSQHKCYHCHGKHETGNRNCDIMKQKLGEIMSRNNALQ